jgi:hydrogenase-4 membrane subunit HyfE
MTSTPTTRIERHPDIMALRSKYAQANETWTAHITIGLILISGLYLAISPWVVGFQALTPLVITNAMTGLIVAALAFGLGATYERLHGLAWVIPVLGVWTLVAPWVIRGGVNTTPAVANNVTTGVICTLLGAAALYMSARQLRR